MAINNLQDIRNACLTYVMQSVDAKIENLVADVPNAISPGEGFRFDLKVTNNGNMRIINVKYFVYVYSSSIAELIVPYWPPTWGQRVARRGINDDSPLFPNGAHTRYMYLFPLDSDRKVLEPGETDIWPNIRGIGNVLGSTKIGFRAYGQIDMDYLFPKNAPGKLATLDIDVV